MLDTHDLAALALTSRLAEAVVKPLSGREFWQVTRNTSAAELRGMTSAEIASKLVIATDKADRIAALFERAASIALALEKLEHSGIWTITSAGKRYPERLRARLGDAAPVTLHGVGDAALLDTDGVGVVGSRNVTEDGAQVARDIAHAAVKAGLPVVSGAARGVDRDAMNGAFEVGGQVIGVLADALQKSVTRPGTRRGIADGSICLITPYAPTAPFSVGNAMGRNKIIYALSCCTVVVASEQDAGGTWAGATEALKHHYGRVAAWAGAGSTPGNCALLEHGAFELTEVERLGDLLSHASPEPVCTDEDLGEQLTLRF
ncbi:hypothetical protein A5761_00725 [Mycolicibacterium setense]|uniref:DNA-processing protein DprA n=1 Tax=Mycolicibacterium setense TaxID=431269 RepID=UPI0003A5E82F|nr:DNA-processing protein DprA [Mycolicibacterium setense]OBB19703.1 hypothetical protein A5761_00725 [Mycolicibacterium setense]